MSRDRAELGSFLRSRRDGLTPAQAGMRAFPGARRVPGLRREELAVLAGLSPDYYSRLEQGRQTNISREVLAALARALRLNEVERAHLSDLAAPLPRARAVIADVAQRADPGLLRVMATMDHVPVLLLGHRGDVLARNALLRAVLGSSLEPGTSFLRFFFFDPRARQRIVNWTDFAQASVAALRRESGRRPHDVALTALIDEFARRRRRRRSVVERPCRARLRIGGQARPPPGGGRPALRHRNPHRGSGTRATTGRLYRRAGLGDGSTLADSRQLGGRRQSRFHGVGAT